MRTYENRCNLELSSQDLLSVIVDNAVIIQYAASGSFIDRTRWPIFEFGWGGFHERIRGRPSSQRDERDPYFAFTRGTGRSCCCVLTNLSHTFLSYERGVASYHVSTKCWRNDERLLKRRVGRCEGQRRERWNRSGSNCSPSSCGNSPLPKSSLFRKIDRPNFLT